MSIKAYALLLALFASAVQAQTPNVVSWVVANRTELDALGTEAAHAKIKAFLAPKLVGKRFVHLGEPDHYYHERWPYRAMVIKVLMELGYTNIVNEMGRADGQKVDAYLETGDMAHLKRVCLYGGCFSPVSYRILGTEEMIYYKGLREAATKLGVRLRHFGWDYDTQPYAGYDGVNATLDAALGRGVDALIQQLKEQLRRRPGEAGEVEGDRVFGALVTLSRNRATLAPVFGKANYEELYWDIRSLSDSLRLMGFAKDAYTRAVNNPADQQAKKEYFQHFILREPTGFDRLRHIVATQPKSAKFILLGHNNHVATHNARTTISYAGIVEDQPMWRSIGEMVALNFPGETFTIWKGIGQGEAGDLDSGVRTYGPLAGTLEASFVPVSPTPWIVSLEGDIPLPASTVYSAQFKDLERGDLKKSAEAYFFLPRSTQMVRQTVD